MEGSRSRGSNSEQNPVIKYPREEELHTFCESRAEELIDDTEYEATDFTPSSKVSSSSEKGEYSGVEEV